MAALVKRVRPGLTDLLWSALPFEHLSLDVLGENALAMRMEEFVDDDTYVVRAELPGVDPDRDVEITVDDGVLTISAERREEKTEGEEGAAGYRSEFRYGSYRRSLALPVGVTPADVTATYADGILEVRVPIRRPTAQARTIPVTRT